MFHFNANKVNYDEGIGTGASGIVYPYQKSPDDDRWVVKRVMTPMIETLLKYVNEIVLGFSCDHPNVLPIRGYHIDFDSKQKSFNIYMKMPRMQETLKAKLASSIKQNKAFTEMEIVRYFYSMTCGLIYLHDRKIAHRDIKPDNILLDKYGKLKIADIGVGKFMEDETSILSSERAGSVLYTAPEVLASGDDTKKKNLYKADGWSLGMVMAELCLLKQKLVDVFSPGEKKEADISRKLKEVKGKYSDKVINLILGLLKCNPNERKNLGEIKATLEESYQDVLVRCLEDRMYN